MNYVYLYMEYTQLLVWGINTEPYWKIRTYHVGGETLAYFPENEVGLAGLVNDY